MRCSFLISSVIPLDHSKATGKGISFSGHFSLLRFLHYSSMAWLHKRRRRRRKKNLLEEGGIYDFINVLFFRFVVARAFNILRVKLRANVWWNEISQTGMYIQETANFTECNSRIVGNSVDTLCWQSQKQTKKCECHDCIGSS